MKPEKTVYSLYLPETRAVIDAELGDGVFRRKFHETLTMNYDPGLDDLHESVIDKFEQHGRLNGVIGWNEFPNKYFTNGSSEGLFHLIAQEDRPLYQLDGEYQGYNEYAQAVGKKVTTVDVADIGDWPSGVFLISNPSAINGNLLRPLTLEAIGQHHDIILDLAYLGMTDPLELSLAQSSIIAVVASMSKPFGMYYYRAGFLWSRKPVASLYGNKRFKNALTIKLAEAVLDAVDLRSVRERYRKRQRDAVDNALAYVNEDGTKTSPIYPSAVWLLASGPTTNKNRSEEYERARGVARYCLTPYYL